MQPHQSKEFLIQSLEGNSTKSYKRKKLKNLPVSDSVEPNLLELTSAEMEIDESEGTFMCSNQIENALISNLLIGLNVDLTTPPLPLEQTKEISPPPPPPPESPIIQPAGEE